MIRSPQKIITRADGQWVNGRWVDGIELPSRYIMASVQPASAGDYDTLRAEEGGRRIEKMVRVYTDEELPVAGQDDSNGAVLEWEGDRYLFIAVSPWRTTRLRHYRYLASKELPWSKTISTN